MIRHCIPDVNGRQQPERLGYSSDVNLVQKWGNV